MKTKIISIVVMLLMAANVMAQDYMRVYFKDGIYKEFYLEGLKEWKVSQYDADGVKHADYKYQHIKTNIHDFVFDLEKIDSIVFTKFDEEKAKQSLFKSLSGVFPIVFECETIEDVERKLDLIKNVECVLDAWCSGLCFMLRSRIGIPFPFFSMTPLMKKIMKKRWLVTSVV